MNDNLCLGICGSPRNEGTEYAVKYALEYVEDKFGFKTEFWTVRAKKIKFCLHCDYCIREQKGCIQKDDVQELYPKLESAKYLILGTPVFQGNVCAQLKAVLDRCRAIVAKDPDVFKNKIGCALAVGGDRSGGQEVAIRTILDFYQQNHVIPISGGAFGANLGASLWARDNGKEGIQKDEEGLRTIRKVMKRLGEFQNKDF